MTDSNIEKMREAQMISFRVEIKRIQDSLRGKDGTIVKVMDLDNLQPEDMEAWEQCKAILKDFYNKTKDLQRFSDLPAAEEYRLLVKKSLEDIPLDDSIISEDRGFFVNWIRNVFTSLYYDLNHLEEDFLEVKEDLRLKLESYGLLSKSENSKSD